MKREVSKFKIVIEKFISKEGILYYHKKKDNHIQVIKKYKVKGILYMMHENSIKGYLRLEVINVKIKERLVLQTSYVISNWF